MVAVVGEGIAFRPGSAAFFTKAMANAGVNIRAIAQGSSERQISICVDRVDCTKALRAAHASLALSNTQLSIAVVGASGQVGGHPRPLSSARMHLCYSAASADTAWGTVTDGGSRCRTPWPVLGRGSPVLGRP